MLGAVVALVGVLTVVFRAWGDLATPTRLVLIGTVTVALYGAALVTTGDRERLAVRLSAPLGFMAAVGAGFFAAILADDVLPLEDGGARVLAGGIVAAVAGSLWRSDRSWLLQLAVVTGLGFVVDGVRDVVGLHGSLWTGAVLWVLGAVWVVLALGQRVRPPVAGALYGAALGMIGAMVMASGAERGPGLVLGLASGGALLALSGTPGRRIHLATGSVAIAIFLPRALREFFGRALGVPLALVVTGLALVVIAAVLSRRSSC